MNDKLYSNSEFTELKKRINAEIIRRGGYKWFDPLSTPKIGEDKTSPLSIPNIGKRVPVDDKTYTINNPSEGSIERTRNITNPAMGENPGGQNPTFDGSEPNTSAAALTVEEIRNFIVGISKIRDINLFYGRDEKAGIAFRDPQDIEDLVSEAEEDELNEEHQAIFRFIRDGDDLILETYIDTDIQGYIDDNGNLIMTYTNDEDMLESFSFEVTDEDDLIIRDKYGIMCFRMDYNGGSNYENPEYPVENPTIYQFPMKDGYYVMPSGERDGEEVTNYKGLGPTNFFDDYGAKPGDGNYHPYNRGTTPQTRRDYYVYDKDRKGRKVIVVQGGIKSSTYGQNPRNPNKGNEYKPIPMFIGKSSTCENACTGLCSMTCDSQCSESCNVTCTVRCGNACTSTCGNVCTGCSSLCYSSCQTKCENAAGYACVKSGAKAVKIFTTGGKYGIPAQNHLEVETFACQGCQYSCQFYPNKKTECWDAACMNKCFTSCSTYCSTSCLGGCINNDATSTKGQGCSAGCTMNCSGVCEGSCEGMCTQSCFHQCKELCSDNCTWICSTKCGAGCDTGCTNGCKGCDGTCESYCTGESDMYGCTGCGTKGGCTSTCQFDCNQNCINKGCRSMCGIDSAGACSNNCRISCSSSSCTSQCENQCTDMCTTCINECGFQCGACSSICSTGCESACNITCTGVCEHSCDTNCVQSCSEECGACSSLCYSCVGMCIGVCSLTCDAGSTSDKHCSWWCDVQCNQICFSNCDDMCLISCNGTCATFVDSDSKLPGPDRGPTSEGYYIPNPENRIEEQESFKNFEMDFDMNLFKLYLTARGELIIEYIGAEDFDSNLSVEGSDLILDSNNTPSDNAVDNIHFDIPDTDLIASIHKEDEDD